MSRAEAPAPTVSVVIPNYNHARFLDKRIQSVLAQTYQDFEIILLDDASTDDSLAVMQRYTTDSRIRTCFNTTNSGSPFAQWNRGVDLARGQYIWIAESDDYADPAFLATLVPLLEQHPGVGLAYCQSYHVDENDRIVRRLDEITKHLDVNHWQRDYINRGRDECARFLLFQNTIPNASAVLFRRSVYLKAGGADTSYRLAGDWSTWARLLLLCDVAFSAQPMNHFRFHEATVRQGANRSGAYLIELYRFTGFLLQQLDVPSASREQALQLCARRWVRYAAEYRMPLQRHREVYRCAASVDARLTSHLARQLVYFTARLPVALWRFAKRTRKAAANASQSSSLEPVGRTRS